MSHTRNRSTLLILGILTLMLAAVLFAVGAASADGPYLWQEKCPTLHYEVVIDQPQRAVVTVSCVRMAE